MPSAPLRYCLGKCGKAVERGYCPACQPAREAGVHYGRKWGKARLAFLADHPFCVECERHSETTVATEVDHIRPHRGSARLFWDQRNWQALCRTCHNRKTATEDGGFVGAG